MVFEKNNGSRKTRTIQNRFSLAKGSFQGKE
ncbi:hypothetical protein P872_13100 [Rhodonellum psychrophilum GCM71 = DSM 17998]|uniref:Uncharacterized protein n=1 Tax=Rhodonellum psychrophilum GCM71 = DSM 17998 TaxID=1123057 RepID=U5BRP2_9BACT|nr:hypothetical protein P872_13100 [Rhodonellum psychrophilum GCM71 = DSM 17998]